MNHAFRSEPFNPHVHWHIFPRYSKAPELDGVVYDDPLYGEFYDDNTKHLVDDEVVQKIATGLREYLVSHV